MSDSNQLPPDAVPVAGSVPVKPEQVSIGKMTYKKPEPIEIQLPDGRKINMAQPKASLTVPLNSILAECPLQNGQMIDLERNMVRMLLYITHIDGVEQNQIYNAMTRAALEEKIGSEFLDGLLVVWSEHFPVVQPAIMQIVKKS